MGGARGTSTLPNNALLSAHCEPLRHPSRPGRALASCQLIPTAITAGASPVAPDPLCLHAVATTPAGSMELIRSVLPHRLRPSPHYSWVGSCITFSRPAQRSLVLQPADSPSRLVRPSTSGRLCCLHRRSNCYRVERSSSRAALLLPAVDQCLFTAHHNRIVMSEMAWLRQQNIPDSPKPLCDNSKQAISDRTTDLESDKLNLPSKRRLDSKLLRERPASCRLLPLSWPL